LGSETLFLQSQYEIPPAVTDWLKDSRTIGRIEN
jgi:hypothetical protein